MLHEMVSVGQAAAQADYQCAHCGAVVSYLSKERVCPCNVCGASRYYAL